MGEPDYAAEAAGEPEQAEPATDSEQPEQAKSVQPDPAEAYAPPLDEAALSEAETRKQATGGREVSVEDAQAGRCSGSTRPSPTSLHDGHRQRDRQAMLSDDTINIDQAESSSDESAADQPTPSEGHPTDDGHR